MTATHTVRNGFIALGLCLLLALSASFADATEAFAKTARPTISKVTLVNCKSKSITLKKGSSKTVYVKVHAKKYASKAKVTFTSSKPSVVKCVKTGSRKCKITGLRAGTAYITVKAKGKNTRTCRLKVTVKKPATKPANPEQPVEPSDNAALTSQFAANSASALLASETENSCYSPLSAYMALSMAGSGATGETGQQIATALGAQSTDELSGNCNTIMRSIVHEPASSGSSAEGAIGGISSAGSGDNSTLLIANSIWGGKEFAFTDSFKSLMTSTFDAEAREVDFADSATSGLVSDWISQKTKGLLHPSLDLSPDTIATLVNTVYFKDNWLENFDAKRTTARMFTTADGTEKQTDFMVRGETGGWFQSDRYTAASLPLTSGGKMTFYLPADGVSANDLISTPESTAELLAATPNTSGTIDWYLPKFGFEAKYSLTGVCKSLGMEAAFDENVLNDFDSMLQAVDPADQRDPYIDDVEQGTRIGVNEDGVEAAAYTAVIMKAAGVGSDMKHLDFDLNRPFVYTITAKDGSVLFIGIVQDPTSE